MSTVLNSMYMDVGEEKWCDMNSEQKSKYGRRAKSPVWWIAVAAACLGLILLFVIFGFVAHNASAIRKQDVRVGLMNFEKLINNLTQKNYALREELNQVKMNSSQLIKDMEMLRGQYNAVLASRDQLQQEVQKINCSMAGKVCQQGWTTFNNKCYYVSKASETKNWERSRLDCQQRGADLVIITSKDEHNFVSKFHQNIWIGLSDKQQEGKWKWVDGSDLVQGFWKSGEPNNAGNEDCAEISVGKWNDVPCSNELPWVCGQ
ncbi:CD209 antigen-like protein D [Pholidichthys leucotaenia]